MSSRQSSFPHHSHPDFELVRDSHDGVFTFLRPTNAKFVNTSKNPDSELEWKSRDQRKARHHQISPNQGKQRYAPTFLQKVLNFRHLEFWNISWWVAMMFTVGSVVWCINGFFVFLPLVNSHVALNLTAVGWTAWLGATIFAFASVLLIWEAWNRGETNQFGWGLDQAIHHKFHHHEFKGEKGETSVYEAGPAETSSDESDQTDPEKKKHAQKRWIWWTTDTKYWRELGFVAGFAQLMAATIFWISGFTAIPQIQDVLQENPAALNGAFWSPQVIGGTGFIISSTLYMLETQKKWYKPAINEVGWHIGFWNFIGAWGFCLSGVFGYCTKSWCVYESSLSTFWGSFAFLIGSVMQWYEAVNPVSNE